ncbi:MAG TPA: ABC transporter permease [Myxococcaceae bacterium]|nr:ABC transporter permease [Myxococcaceae bacterium]
MKVFSQILRRSGFLILLLLTWYLLTRFGPWPTHLFPGPEAVLRDFIKMLIDGRLVRATIRSLGRMSQGYLIAVAIGIPLGVATARFKIIRDSVKPVLMGFQGLPSICWLPLALLWFGLTDAAIIFVVVMGSLLSIAIGTEDAVSGINPILLLAAGTLGIRGPRFYGGVLLAASLPGIVTGLKLGWSFAWRALMAGELLFISGGLGQLLNTGRELMEVSQVMAVMLAIIAVGTGVDRLVFQSVELRIRRRWGLLAPA